MNCEEVSELLPAYALGALDRDDLDAVEAHLHGCREHDEELTELRATVFALDHHGETAAQGAGASTALAERVRVIVESPAKPEAAAAPRRKLVSLSKPWGAMAAAVALLLVFGAGWLAGSTLGGGEEAFAYQLQDANGQIVEVAGVAGSDSVTVTMDNIDQAPSGSAYQLWAVREDGWVSIGTCNTNENGWWRGDFAFSFQRGEEIALTVEPEEGSDSPSGEPVMRGEF